MSRFAVIGFMTCVVIVVASFAFASGNSHHNHASVSHAAKHSSHHSAAGHNHNGDCSHGVQKNHPAKQGTHRSHWGHTFLRWLHNGLDRLRGSHGGSHTSAGTVTSHPTDHVTHNGTAGHNASATHAAPCHTEPLH